MATEIAPLPVETSPASNENGAAFLLRCAQRNGMSLKAMLNWVGISSLQSISPAAVPALALATQASQSWLLTYLPMWRRRERARCQVWHGRSWSVPLALRGLHSQVCPACLREGLPCQVKWEMTGAFGCLNHRRALIDRCPQCSKPLLWTRPAAEVCCCGRYLTSGEPPAVLANESMEWIESLCQLLGAPDAPPSGYRFRPAWLGLLSPDGAFCVVHAAGVRSRPGTPVPPSCEKVRIAPAEMAEVMARGLRRLRDAGSVDEPCSAELRATVYEQGIERLSRRGETDADRNVAHELLAWIRDVPRHGLSLTGRRPLGQLNLFERAAT
jgi:hypothetical protein